MINVGRVARELRESLGLTQRAAAEELRITDVHLCNIENDKAMPSAALLERYRNAWGVDLYVLAWCRHGDKGKLPKGVREAASRLENVWTRGFEETIEKRRRKAGS